MKELGRITKATFGKGGYQDAMFGFAFTLRGAGWGCGDFKSLGWDDKELSIENVNVIRNMMNDAKVSDFSNLVGIPIEAEFDGPGGALKSWRILTEVL